MMIRCVQFESFGEISEKIEIEKLKSLAPFIDNKGLLRICGRIDNADLAYGKKYPYIGPNRSKFIVLMTDYVHIKYFYCGVLFLVTGCDNVFRS